MSRPAGRRAALNLHNKVSRDRLLQGSRDRISYPHRASPSGRFCCTGGGTAAIRGELPGSLTPPAAGGGRSGASLPALGGKFRRDHDPEPNPSLFTVETNGSRGPPRRTKLGA